jgi:hypothetical protein
MLSILQIIKEEVQNFYSDWSMSDEPSIADKIYSRNHGIDTDEVQRPINAELVGYVNKRADKPLNPPVPVYKNPKTLDGFTHDTRGILMSNGDLYLAQSYNALHDNILDLLAEKNIVSYASKFGYADNYPSNFVAVMRAGGSKTFGQSSAYDEFPMEYEEIFNNGEAKQPYGFKGYQY